MFLKYSLSRFLNISKKTLICHLANSLKNKNEQETDKKLIAMQCPINYLPCFLNERFWP